MKGELLAAHRTAPAAQPCVRQQGHDAEIAVESRRTTQRKEQIMPTNTIRFHRVLRATPERIYRAFVDADALAKWLPPNGFTGTVHNMEAKVGGTYKMSFANFTTGRSHFFGGKYLELVPHERIRHADKFDDPNLPGEMQTTITLKKVSCGTELKIVVIGGSGLIGTKLVKNLRQHGHEVVAASPSSGVNTLTGEGLAEALAGAQVVVDVANSPSFEDKAVLEFFETAGRNLLAAEATAGVGHHVALSVVGTDRLLASGYFRAKMAQENLIKASKIPYTIIRSTQFFEFVSAIAQSATDGQTVRLPPALLQPIVSDDVAAAVADIAVGEPLNGTVELAGPEPIRLDELVRRFLSANRDARKVTTDVHALYFGIELNDQSLTPGDNPRIGPTRFGDWLSRSIPHG